MNRRGESYTVPAIDLMTHRKVYLVVAPKAVLHGGVPRALNGEPAGTSQNQSSR
jgi:hypothetical protein